jgi:hypothetical protein
MLGPCGPHLRPNTHSYSDPSCPPSANAFLDTSYVTPQLAGAPDWTEVSTHVAYSMAAAPRRQCEPHG